MKTRSCAYSPAALAILTGMVLPLGAIPLLLDAFGINIHFTR